jgi:CheY-like chemotaxis protein/anti-sigma regulatory factor (Ser/Thr protein kinase)
MPPASHLKRDELSELKYHFLTSLNHELRTPLNGILGLAELLLEGNLNEQDKQHACSLKACAEGLSEVIDATLQYSALAAGNVAIEESEFHVGQLMRVAVSKHQAEAQEKGISMSLSLDLALPETVVGDALRIGQVARVLVSNAVKFTRQGEVSIHVRPHFEADRFHVQVIVKDTGIGIQAEHQRKIFEEFHQLETGLARRFAGLGLGLASAQKVAHLLHGTISLESTPGQGSTFCFTVPVRNEVSPTLPILQFVTASPLAPSSSNPRVLVVEDNEVAQRIVTRTLSKRNYQVVSAYTGLQAIEQVRHSVFDLILMDLQMPEMDGIEAAVRIGQEENGRAVPIVAFTANSTSEYREMCSEAGFAGFLAKPVNATELLNTVDGFCLRNEAKAS